MFKKVLVPLDRSPLAEHAIDRAIAIATASQAALDFVLVHKTLSYTSIGFDGAEAQAVERQYLESIVADVSARTSLSVTHAVMTGDIVDAICRRIEDVNADLVVMASHGRTGASRAWFGSVSDGVIRQSLVPVFVLRTTDGAPTQATTPSRLLVLLDGSAHAAEVLPAAVDLRACLDANLTLLRVIEPIAATAPAGDSRFDYVPPIVDADATWRLADEATAQLAETARRLRDATDTDVNFEVVVGASASTAILDFIGAHDIDGIAMSTHGRGLSRLLVGSVADDVLRGSGLPMLVYRPFARDGDAAPAQGEDVVAHMRQSPTASRSVATVE